MNKDVSLPCEDRVEFGDALFNYMESFNLPVHLL